MEAPTPTLTGIITTEGQCARCDRELGKVYEVRHPDGTVATYGRRCCAKVTGYRPNHLDKLAAQAARVLAMATRQAQVDARYPATAIEARNWDVAETVATDALWDGRGTRRWATWTDKLDEILG